MKRIIVGIICCILIIGFANISFANEQTLDKIIEVFNKSKIVEEYEKKISGNVTAKRNTSGIDVEIDISGKKEKVEYILEGNILKAETTENEKGLITAYIGMNIYAAMGENQGLNPSEVIENLNILGEKLNLKDNGFQSTKEGNNHIVKIDITKTIKLIDNTNIYISVEDIQNKIKELNSNSITFSKGKLIYSINHVDENIAEIRICERKKITGNTYKSMLSAIEHLLGSQESSKYFEKNYPNLEIKNKEFKGIKIEINPKKVGIETEIEENYEFVRLTVNKSEVNSALKEEKDTSNIEKKEENSNIQKLPDTGINNNEVVTKILVLIIIIAIIIIGKIIITKRD